MPESEIAKFVCPGCWKQYRWTERVAGKQVRCSCGQTISVPRKSPQDAGGDDEEIVPEFDSYDVAEDHSGQLTPLKPLAAAAPRDAPAVTVGADRVSHPRRSAAARRAEPDERSFKQIEVTLPLLMVVGGMFGFAIAIMPVIIMWNETHRLNKLAVTICSWISAGMLVLIIGGVLLQMYNVRGDTRPDGQSTSRWTLIRVLGGTGLVIVGVGISAFCFHIGWPDRVSIPCGMATMLPGMAMIARTLAPRF